MKLYKVLDAEGESCNGGEATWSLPVKREDGTWQPGEWMPAIEGKLVPCKNGYHACRTQDLVEWLGETIYRLEYRGELVEDDDKVVVREARLLKRYESWTEQSARLFACWCVRNTPLAGGKTTWDLLNDPRSKTAVEVAERYANGEATSKELASASAAAAAWASAAAAAWASASAAAAAWASAAAAAAARESASASAAAAAAARESASARAAQTEQLMKVLAKGENGDSSEVLKR